MEPAVLPSDNFRYKHSIYRAQLTTDAYFEATTLRGTPIIAIVSEFEAKKTLPVHWTLVLLNEQDGDIVFFDAVRGDWTTEHIADEVSLKTTCEACCDCSPGVSLKFNADTFASLFQEQIQSAIAGCEIGSGWDGSIERLVDDLLLLVSETVELPPPFISFAVLEGGTPFLKALSTNVPKGQFTNVFRKTLARAGCNALEPLIGDPSRSGDVDCGL